MTQLESAVVYNTISQDRKLKASAWLHLGLVILYVAIFIYSLGSSVHLVHVVIFLFLTMFSILTLISFWSTYLKFPKRNSYYHIPIMQFVLVIISILMIKVFFFINNTELTIVNDSPFRVEVLYTAIEPNETKILKLETNLKSINFDFTCFKANIAFTNGEIGIFPFRTKLKYKIQKMPIESGIQNANVATYNSHYVGKFLLPNSRAIKFIQGPYKINFQNLRSEMIKAQFALYDDNCSLVNEVEKVITPNNDDYIEDMKFPKNPYFSRLILSLNINGQYYRSSFWSTEEDVTITNMIKK